MKLYSIKAKCLITNKIENRAERAITQKEALNQAKSWFNEYRPNNRFIYTVKKV